MAEKPKREFGARKPVAIQPAAPSKRSNHVALLLMGTFALGGGAYALMPRESCERAGREWPRRRGCKPARNARPADLHPVAATAPKNS
jgi:hypothetical protein